MLNKQNKSISGKISQISDSLLSAFVLTARSASDQYTKLTWMIGICKKMRLTAFILSTITSGPHLKGSNK